jgi:hypothetical protein
MSFSVIQNSHSTKYARAMTIELFTKQWKMHVLQAAVRLLKLIGGALQVTPEIFPNLGNAIR